MKYENQIIHGDCLEVLPQIPPNSIDLVIADPPYFKTTNQSWDYKWRTLQDYIDWSKKWLSEVSRIAKLNVSFYLFGYFRTMCYLVPTMEKNFDFKLRQEIIIDKGMRAISGRATKSYKLFPNTKENLFFFVYHSRKEIKEFLKQRQKEKGLSAREINKRLGARANGGGVWSIYTGDNVCGNLPPKEKWEKLQEILDFDKPYEEISYTFNTEKSKGMTNVWKDIDFYGFDRVHPTQKPLELIERIVKTSSSEGDVVLAPFVGSGTVACACKRLNRKYIGIEINEAYVEMARERVRKQEEPISNYL